MQFMETLKLKCKTLNISYNQNELKLILLKVPWQVENTGSNPQTLFAHENYLALASETLLWLFPSRSLQPLFQGGIIVLRCARVVNELAFDLIPTMQQKDKGCFHLKGNHRLSFMQRAE